MSAADIEEILGFIVSTYEKANGVDKETELVRSEIIDSFGIVHMIEFLEQRFAVRFPDEEIKPENFRNAIAIADCIIRIRAGR